jgi:hypothetical protein
VRFKEGDKVIVIIDSEINQLNKGDVTEILGLKETNKKDGNVWKVSTSNQGYYDYELELLSVYESPLYKALR